MQVCVYVCVRVCACAFQPRQYTPGNIGSHWPRDALGDQEVDP